MLRPYQENAVNQALAASVNSCIVLPTGSGKSHVIAEIVKRSSGRVLMLTDRKELIEQNYNKLMLHYPEADAGIYSASVGRKELQNRITFAGIQSIHRRASDIPPGCLAIIKFKGKSCPWSTAFHGYAASDNILYVSRVCLGAAVQWNAGRSFLNRKSKIDNDGETYKNYCVVAIFTRHHKKLVYIWIH